MNAHLESGDKLWATAILTSDIEVMLSAKTKLELCTVLRDHFQVVWDPKLCRRVVTTWTRKKSALK